MHEKKNNGLYLQNMTFYFAQSSAPFFENISLNFEAGKIHFIKGHNGSGKSTLLRILKGSIDQSEKVEGQLFLDNSAYTFTNNVLDYAYTQSIKSVVQNVQTMVADAFSVEENLQLANMSCYPILQPLPVATLIHTILENTGISLAQRVSALSGGQRQILAVMMMLQKPTKIVLLDEPTAALDNKNAHMVMQCLQKLAYDLNLTVIIISHDKELVDTYATDGYTHISVESNGKRKVHTVTRQG